MDRAKDQRLAEIRQSHSDLVAEADATEAAAHRLMLRLTHLARAIEDLRLRVGGSAIEEDMADMREALPAMIGGKLSESGLGFGSMGFLPPEQRQIKQWLPAVDKVLSLASRRAVKLLDK